MKLLVYSIDSTLFSGDVKSITAGTAMGEISVLDGHLPLVTALKGPEVHAVDNSGKKITLPFSSGILEVRPENETVILVNP